MSFEVGDYVDFKLQPNKFYRIKKKRPWNGDRNEIPNTTYIIEDIQTGITDYALTDNELSPSIFKLHDYVKITDDSEDTFQIVDKHDRSYLVKDINTNKRYWVGKDKLYHHEIGGKSAKFLAFGNGKFEIGDYVQFINPMYKGLFQIVSKNIKHYTLRNVDTNLTIWWIPVSEIEHAIINKGEKSAQFRAIGKKKKRSKNK
jgi:hypothetical protein